MFEQCFFDPFYKCFFFDFVDVDEYMLTSEVPASLKSASSLRSLEFELALHK